jgi:hypothetical protein
MTRVSLFDGPSHVFLVSGKYTSSNSANDPRQARIPGVGNEVGWKWDTDVEMQREWRKSGVAKTAPRD